MSQHYDAGDGLDLTSVQLLMARGPRPGRGSNPSAIHTAIKVLQVILLAVMASCATMTAVSAAVYPGQSCLVRSHARGHVHVCLCP